MKNEKFKEWVNDVTERAVKTMAETMLSMLTVGMAITDVDWFHVLSVTALSGIITVLFNIKNYKKEEQNNE